mgnify:CR=1 FL=1
MVPAEYDLVVIPTKNSATFPDPIVLLVHVVVPVNSIHRRVTFLSLLLILGILVIQVVFHEVVLVGHHDFCWSMDLV